MLDVNLGPALWLTQAVAPHMRQQGSGAIVHVAARPGIEPASGMGHVDQAARSPPGRRAVTQPRLQGRIRSGHPGTA